MKKDAAGCESCSASAPTHDSGALQDCPLDAGSILLILNLRRFHAFLFRWIN